MGRWWGDRERGEMRERKNGREHRGEGGRTERVKEKKKEEGEGERGRDGSVGSGVLGHSASGSRLSAEAKSQTKHI